MIMFIDANDGKWSLNELENLSHTKPLSVCFMDEYGNSFLNRVRECMGKPILLSLGIPFECYIEEGGKNHIKRSGFLLVNNYMGMMYGYGFLEKLKEDFIPLLQKKDLTFLNKKGILCFLDYGSFFIEKNKNIWIPKESMGNGIDMTNFARYSKNPKRYLYDFHHRRPFENKEANLEEQERLLFLEKCNQMKNVLKSVGIEYSEKREEWMTCGFELTIKKEDWSKVLQAVSRNMYFKKVAYQESDEEYWVMEKIPIFAEENVVYLEEWQCEWLQVPYVIIKKTP